MAIMLPLAIAQDFSGTVPCPADATINGYVSIAALNEDMQTELDRISRIGMGERMSLSYEMILCPGETFNATSDGPIEPVLNNLLIRCANSTETSPSICTVTGGSSNQVLVVDSNITGYPLDNMEIMGVTFEDFSSFSIDFMASQPTALTITDAVWQDFDATHLALVYGVDNPGTLVVTDSIIQRGIASFGFFFNVAGTVRIERLAMRNSRTETFLYTSFGGMSFMKNILLTTSEIAVILNTIESTTVSENVKITRNEYIGDGILTEGENATTNVTSMSITENRNFVNGENFLWTAFQTIFEAQLFVKDLLFANNENFEFIFSTQAAQANVTGVEIVNNTNPDQDETVLGFFVGFNGTMEITDTIFQNNTNVTYAVRISSNSSETVVDIVDTDFIGNIATPTAIASSMVRAFSGTANLLRVEFEGNIDFQTSIYASNGSSIDFQDSCWFATEDEQDLLVLVGSGSDETNVNAANNYVAPFVNTTLCQESGMRVGIGTDSDDPDMEDDNVKCIAGADTVDTCLATVPTSPPTKKPAMFQRARYRTSNLIAYHKLKQLQGDSSTGGDGKGGGSSKKSISAKSQKKGLAAALSNNMKRSKSSSVKETPANNKHQGRDKKNPTQTHSRPLNKKGKNEETRKRPLRSFQRESFRLYQALEIRNDERNPSRRQ